LPLRTRLLLCFKLIMPPGGAECRACPSCVGALPSADATSGFEHTRARPAAGAQHMLCVIGTPESAEALAGAAACVAAADCGWGCSGGDRQPGRHGRGAVRFWVSGAGG